MANIVIRSEEVNAAATALSLAARQHSVCLLTSPVAPGEHHFEHLGVPRTVRLRTLEELDPMASRVGIVFAEGENVQDGIRDVVESKVPDLIVVIGGGILAAVEASEAAGSLSYDASRILLVGAFLVGGNTTNIKAEKRGVLSGFLAGGTPDSVLDLAESTFPQISIVDGLAVPLSSINALVHVPPMILNAMSVERGDDVRLYVEGFGDSVCRLLLELDEDRIRLGAALGFPLLSVEELKNRYSGTTTMQSKTFREKFNTSAATQSIKIPSSFHHRFFAHELRSTFAPMSELARSAQIDVPTIRSVVRIGEILLDTDLEPESNILAQKFLRLIDANRNRGCLGR